MASLELILVSFAIVMVAGQLKPMGTVIVMMNGHSNPLRLYKNDPYTGDEHWPEGMGQLTTEGMKQIYKLGEEARVKYKHLLSDIYNKEEIYVTAADTDRTLMTAETYLAGLYYTFSQDRFAPNLAWRPVPVHTMPSVIDHKLIMFESCPRQQSMRENLANTENFQKFVERYQWVRRHVETNTNVKLNDRYYADLILMYEVLKMEEFQNKPLPEWTKDIYPTALEQIANYTITVPTATPQMAKLTIGPLVTQIVKDLLDIVSNKTTQKIKIYCGLDYTLSNLLHGMNLKKNVFPPPGAMIQFDLIDATSTMKGVQIYYNGDMLRVPDCGYFCEIDKFKEKYKSLYIKNRMKACGWGGNPYKIVSDGVMPDTEFGVLTR